MVLLVINMSEAGNLGSFTASIVVYIESFEIMYQDH